MRLVRRCDKCQILSLVRGKPTTPLTPILSPLPFTTLGMDILGPFPKATDQRKYLFGAIAYFTKWIEVEAIASITAVALRKFIWENIITRPGVLRAI